MRIIKHGNQYELGEVTCPNCECQFVYNKDDIEEIENIIFASEENEEDIHENLINVYCPECNYIICISKINNKEEDN